MTDRRSFIKTMGAGLAASTTAATQLANAPKGDSENLLASDPRQPEPAPMGYDRLPLEWYQATTSRLKEKVAESGVEAILFSRDPNMVYFTGCFRGSGLRSTWVLFDVNEKDTVYWFSPGIDRELIGSWWSTENEYYFGFPHAKGAFPNRGIVNQNERVDLFAWMLAGLARRGMSGKNIGVDWNLSEDQLQKAAEILPGATFTNISETCVRMQMIKRPEEIALAQRAYRYFDRVHAFARDFILERGTDTTDFEIGQALQAFGFSILMNDLKRDGRPHSAVGMDVSSHYVRTGMATSFPHPNQFFYNKVKRGDSLYVNTDLKIGGYGGECYRNYQIAPVSPEQEKMWDVVRDTVQIMVEETKPGVRGSDVAAKVHQYQIDNGMQDYIYHRPAHGTGQNYVGHQAPYLALGDHTIIEEGMMFSVEPGLYDVERGFGINPSDNLLVLADGAVMQSSVPFSKEWSFLEI